jgi:hypothetical protein
MPLWISWPRPVGEYPVNGSDRFEANCVPGAPKDSLVILMSTSTTHSSGGSSDPAPRRSRLTSLGSTSCPTSTER